MATRDESSHYARRAAAARQRENVPQCPVCCGYDIPGGHRMPTVTLLDRARADELVTRGENWTGAKSTAVLLCEKETAPARGAKWDHVTNSLPQGREVI